MPGVRAWGPALVVAVVLTTACKGRDRSLTPPRGAADWDASYGTVFDDGLTSVPVELSGRAPHDVRDQKLFHMRLGYADVVALVTVEEAWSEGLGERRDAHSVGVVLDRVLLGEDQVKRAAREQDLRIELGPGGLGSSIQGGSFLFFLRWAPDQEPPYHHHLLVATDEAVATAESMIEDARAAGFIGSAREKRRARRKQRKRAKERGEEVPVADPDVDLGEREPGPDPGKPAGSEKAGTAAEKPAEKDKPAAEKNKPAAEKDKPAAAGKKEPVGAAGGGGEEEAGGQAP